MATDALAAILRDAASRLLRMRVVGVAVTFVIARSEATKQSSLAL
jgi:hypothetical protein